MFFHCRSVTLGAMSLSLMLGLSCQGDSARAQMMNPNLCERYPEDLRCSLFNYSTPATEPTPIQVAQQPDLTRPRIAVLQFDQQVQDFPAGQGGAIPSLSSLLIDQLVRTGTYVVVERGAIDAVLREQDLAAQGRINTTTAAQIGRVLGVDAVVIATVTQFDLSSRKSGGGFPVLAPLGRSPIGLGATTTDWDATVRLNVRLVSTTTGQILTTAAGLGTSSQSSSTVTIAGIGGGSQVDNQTKLLTIAADQAIRQITPQLTAASGLVRGAGPFRGIQGVIADVTGSTVIINRGSSHGYQVGQTLTVERVIREVTDPETGEPLREITKPIGQVQVTEVDEGSSVGVILTATDLAVGDVTQLAGQQ